MLLLLEIPLAAAELYIGLVFLVFARLKAHFTELASLLSCGTQQRIVNRPKVASLPLCWDTENNYSCHTGGRAGVNRLFFEIRVCVCPYPSFFWNWEVKKTPRSIHSIPPNTQRSLATYSSFQHVGRQVLCFIGTFQGSDLLPWDQSNHLHSWMCHWLEHRSYYKMTFW